MDRNYNRKRQSKVPLIEEHVRYFGIWDLEGNVEDVIRKLQEVCQEARKQNPSILPDSFEIEIQHYSDETEASINYLRPETEAETASRLEREANAKLSQEEREKQLLESLKKKYEGK